MSNTSKVLAGKALAGRGESYLKGNNFCMYITIQSLILHTSS